MKSLLMRDDSTNSFERSSFLLETELAILESFEKLMLQEEQSEKVKQRFMAKKALQSLRYRRSA